MSEITKLYENAEVKRQIPKVCSSNELYCKECEAHIEDAMTYCKNAEYPLFTAEKQIELIKLLAKGEVKINNEDGEYEFSLFDTISDFSSFEESLADLTNRMWQDLTEEERKHIKEILE